MIRNLLVPLILSMASFAAAQEPLYDKVFFANSPMDNNYFYSQAAYSAPSWIKNVAGKLPVSDSVFFTPGNSLELNYVSASRGKWKAAVQLRETRGVDFFSKAVAFHMHLYVSSETAVDELPQICVGGRKKDTTNFINLVPYVKKFQRNKWLDIRIPLDSLHPGSDTMEFDVVFFRGAKTGVKEHRIFIDQLELVPAFIKRANAEPVLASARGYEKHVDIEWRPVATDGVKYVKVYRSTDKRNFFPVGIQSPYISRYTDYTGETGREYHYRISLLDQNYDESNVSNIVSAGTKPMNDDQLLDMVQEAHFRYYWEGAEQNSGLALENIHGRRHMIATGASGFGMMALVTGAARKFITHNQLQQRFEKILSFLEKADRFHGAFPHFLNGETGKVEAFFGSKDNGADLVETSFLAQGLLVAKQYFSTGAKADKQLALRIDRIWKAIEWDWFRKDSASKFLYWHWSPDQAWVINHKLIGWNETMITYFLAIASRSHGIPASFYYSGWASQSEEAKKYRSAWGETTDGSAYKNGNTYFGIPLNVGVSNGGPLFFVHYSYLGLDPHRLNDAYTNYFDNNRNIALINYRYCVENPAHHKGYGADAWGLTASDGIFHYQADEPVPHQDHGKITPTGALASFPYTPAESMSALKNYYRNYGKFAWGEYGFRDAFNLDENWCSNIFMGLNQAPIAVMIENYRSGLIWKLFMNNPEVETAVKEIAAEPK